MCAQCFQFFNTLWSLLPRDTNTNGTGSASAHEKFRLTMKLETQTRSDARRPCTSVGRAHELYLKLHMCNQYGYCWTSVQPRSQIATEKCADQRRRCGMSCVQGARCPRSHTQERHRTGTLRVPFLAGTRSSNWRHNDRDILPDSH